MSEYAWEGMPLCEHGIQFDCERCRLSVTPVAGAAALLARLLYVAGAVRTRDDSISLAFALSTVLEEEGYRIVKIDDSN